MCICGTCVSVYAWSELVCSLGTWHPEPAGPYCWPCVLDQPGLRLEPGPSSSRLCLGAWQVMAPSRASVPALKPGCRRSWQPGQGLRGLSSSPSQGDQGGESSLSVSKWNTFLKAMLVCSDVASNKNFNRLQDVFLLPDPNGQWRDTRVYGVFSNPW